MTLARPPRPAQVQHLVAPVGVRDLPVEIPRRESIASVRQELTDRAEYGRWELARTRIFLGGDKKVWLRRRITRVVSTLHGPIDA